MTHLLCPSTRRPCRVRAGRQFLSWARGHQPRDVLFDIEGEERAVPNQWSVQVGPPRTSSCLTPPISKRSSTGIRGGS